MQAAFITDASEEARGAQIFLPNAVKVCGLTLEQLRALRGRGGRGCCCEEG